MKDCTKCNRKVKNNIEHCNTCNDCPLYIGISHCNKCPKYINYKHCNNCNKCVYNCKIYYCNICKNTFN